MSNALAISAVSAVLQYMLNSVLNASGLGSVTVLAIAPDLAQSAIRSGQDANPTLNLFLHQVTLNAAWRNVGLPSLAADGATQLKNPPLALDLHYLLTAYAGVNFQAEALLGFAIQMLHASPVLPRGQVSSILTKIHNDNTSDPLLGGLQSSGLASQIEMIKITPATLGREEMAWLWTALTRGELHIQVRTCPLEDLPSAWRAQAFSPHAKCVIAPDRTSHWRPPRDDGSTRP